MSNRKINEKRFNEIKKLLNTKILVFPSISYVADVSGYSTGTIATIKKSRSYKEYKEWQHRNQIKFRNNYLDNEMQAVSEERKKAQEEIAKFNNEWFFEAKNELAR